MTDWNIQGRAHTCQGCGKNFADKEIYHTLLFDEKAAFLRLDICQPCWQKQYSDGARERKGFVSYWQGTYEAPAASVDPIQKETAESLLRKLTELNDPRYIPAAFILAVMLERKRLLKVKEQLMRDSHRVFIYEQPRTGDVFTIVDPKLQINQLELVQKDVAALLEHGLEGEALAGAGAAAHDPATAGPIEIASPACEAAPLPGQPQPASTS